MLTSIKSRLIAAVLALALCLGIGGAIGWGSLSYSSKKIDTIIADRVEPLKQLSTVSALYGVNIVDTAWKTRTGQIDWKEAADRVEAAKTGIHKNWSDYTATYLTPKEKELAAQSASAMQEADQAVDRLQSILGRHDQSALEAFTNKDMYAAIDPVSAKISALVDLQIDVAREEGAAAHAVAGWMLMSMLGIGALALVAIAYSVWTVVAGVTRPMQALTGMMQKLAKGALDIDVPGQDRKDELGDMSRAVVIFRENAVERARLEREAETQRSLTDQERRAREAAAAADAAEQAKVVGQVGEGLARLSSGDLTFRIETPFAPAYEKLRDDFNTALRQLQLTMTNIVNRTFGLRASSEEITHASDDLSKRTEQQAASLEQTAAALDQITAAVRRTAEGAKEANSIVASAKSAAEASTDVMMQAVGAMREIEQGSNEIRQIIGVIDEIAFQTNLLVLNAGVEAARAGDAGRGFAVVASEVRALAQRSADAAKEIKTLISASTDQVSRGVGCVGQTGDALTRIVEQVAKINVVVSEISASAHEQATGLQQVNTAVNQMDQVTQQNAAMVEQATAAGHALREETDGLSRMMSEFKVGEQAARTASPTTRQRPYAQQVSKAVTVKSAYTAAGAPAVAEAGWDEF